MHKLNYSPPIVKTEEQKKADLIKKSESVWRFKKRLSKLMENDESENKEFFLHCSPRIRDCSAYGEIKEYLLDNYRIKKSRKCHLLVCPACQWSKSNTRVSNLQGCFEILYKKYNPMNLQAFQFVISPKNCENLKDGIESAFRIIEKCFGCHNRWGNFFSKSREILGGCVSFECTRNRKNNTWHPHFHGVVFVLPELVPQGSNSWFEYNEFIIDEEKGTKANNFWSYKLQEYINKNLKTPAFVNCSPSRNFFECVKYAVKPNCNENSKSTGLTPKECLELWAVLRDLKKQTFRTYGVLRKVELDDETLLDHGEEYILYKFAHNNLTGEYQEQTYGEVFREETKDKEKKILEKFSKELDK